MLGGSSPGSTFVCPKDKPKGSVSVSMTSSDNHKTKQEITWGALSMSISAIDVEPRNTQPK